jgi:hypothetical protein
VSHYSGDGHVDISVVDDADVVDDVDDGEDEADGGGGDVDDVWSCWLWRCDDADDAGHMAIALTITVKITAMLWPWRGSS